MLNTNISPRCDFFIRTNSLGLQRRAKQALSTKSLVDEPVDKSGTSVYSWGVFTQKLWTRWGVNTQFFASKSH
jgi:hypothetical protein